MPPWLRWLLVLPCAYLAWIATALLGMMVHARAELAWCPAPDWVSDFCTNQQVQARLDLLIVLFAGLSAVAVIVAASAMAPARKVTVAWCALGTGAVLSALLDFGSPPFYAAVSAGSLTSLALSLRR
ncbi:hypothetical protein SAMN04244573_01366 [Azotobacter beijerinckii]|uniref:Uncharacterized protein n=1 Tax=Azotobacter beijerinckii TaxID=170623 RepID=A0A1H9F214_9GAMM|nr:hypothetical protein [Azotobacter beijerinckii]SEQ31278.1 hypothetical protein SAMN04244573_01366 [Azotobacter beijerinckii]